MNILIIDDSIDKISRITSCIAKSVDKFTIESSQDAANSLVLFSKIQYDLAIIDHLLPFRVGDDPNPEGGKNIVDELLRKKEKFFLPKYIIGVTQYDYSSSNFSPLWQTIHYDPSSDGWERNLQSLISYIQKVNTYPSVPALEKKPTIFLEGESDRIYIEQSISHFYPDLSDNVTIKTQSNAGANWVGSQISAWAIQMDKVGDAYLKAVGLLDGDEAGNLAKAEVHRVVITNNKKQTFSLIQIGAKYGEEVREYYRRGLKIDLEIESLLPISVLSYADNSGWLQNRFTVFNSPPKGWDQLAQTAKEFLLSSGIKEEAILYTKQVKIEHKKSLSDYIVGQSNLHEILKNYEPLVKDILIELSLLSNNT